MLSPKKFVTIFGCAILDLADIVLLSPSDCGEETEELKERRLNLCLLGKVCDWDQNYKHAGYKRFNEDAKNLL